MSVVINSKETQLEPAQVILEFAENYNSTKHPTAVVAAAISKELLMEEKRLSEEYAQVIIYDIMCAMKYYHQ